MIPVCFLERQFLSNWNVLLKKNSPQLEELFLYDLMFILARETTKHTQAESLETWLPKSLVHYFCSLALCVTVPITTIPSVLLVRLAVINHVLGTRTKSVVEKPQLVCTVLVCYL